MDRLRQMINERPAMGWAVAAVLLILIAFSIFRWRRADDNPYTLDRTTEMVTIKCRETGDEWTMPRGRMEQMLWDRPAPLDPNQGVPNPKTGRPTGFPKSDWESTIDRISAERREIAAKRSRGTDAPVRK
jgi:hypothetical protein